MNTQEIYKARRARYLTALRNEKPDKMESLGNTCIRQLLLSF